MAQKRIVPISPMLDFLNPVTHFIMKQLNYSLKGTSHEWLGRSLLENMYCFQSIQHAQEYFCSKFLHFSPSELDSTKNTIGEKISESQIMQLSIANLTPPIGRAIESSLKYMNNNFQDDTSLSMNIMWRRTFTPREYIQMSAILMCLVAKESDNHYSTVSRTIWPYLISRYPACLWSLRSWSFLHFKYRNNVFEQQPWQVVPQLLSGFQILPAVVIKINKLLKYDKSTMWF